METAVCDFCCGKMPTWTVICDPIDVVIVDAKKIIRQSEDWGACTKCVELIKKREIDGLADRVINSPVLNEGSKESFRERLIPLYKAIFSTIKSIKEDGLTSAL